MSELTTKNNGDGAALAAALGPKSYALECLGQRRVAIFLELVADGSSPRHAASKIGYTRQRLYQIRARDDAFAALWAEAYEMGTDVFEDALNEQRRKGNIAAIIFGLKCRRPEIYNPKMHVHQISPERTAAPEVLDGLARAEQSAELAAPSFRIAAALPAPADPEPTSDTGHGDTSEAGADPSRGAGGSGAAAPGSTADPI